MIRQVRSSSQYSILFLVLGLSIAVVSCDMKAMSSQMRYNRARNLHDKGKIDEAIEVYKEVLKETEKNTEVHYDLGVAYADNQDIINAKKQVAILKELNRHDLAEVLSGVIRDISSSAARDNRKKQ